jgi:hypothetical protein
LYFLANRARLLEMENGKYPDWIRPGRAARMLGVHHSTLWRWTKSGLIESISVGKQTRYEPREISRALRKLNEMILNPKETLRPRRARKARSTVNLNN